MMYCDNYILRSHAKYVDVRYGWLRIRCSLIKGGLTKEEIKVIKFKE